VSGSGGPAPQALHAQLRVECPERAPALPARRLFGGLSPPLVAERRHRLQEFLDACVADRALAASPAFRDFIDATGREEEERALAGGSPGDQGPALWSVPPGAPSAPVFHVLEALRERRRAAAEGAAEGAGGGWGDADFREEARALNCLGLILLTESLGAGGAGSDAGGAAARRARGLGFLEEAAQVCAARLAAAPAPATPRDGAGGAGGAGGADAAARAHEFWGEGAVTCTANHACALALGGDLEAALARLGESVRGAGARGDVVGQGRGLAKMATVLAALPDAPGAIKVAHAAQEMLLAAGQPARAAALGLALGGVYLSQGELRLAVATLEESLVARRRCVRAPRV